MTTGLASPRPHPCDEAIELVVTPAPESESTPHNEADGPTQCGFGTGSAPAKPGVNLETRQARRRGVRFELMTPARRLHYTYAEYLAALEVSGVKLEFCEGEIYAMAGGTPAHADLAASMTRLLGNALQGHCRVSSSDLKVRIEATDLSTFPDVTVACGERRVALIDRNAVINPTLLVEVTSNSTEDYDRGEKLSHYQQCPSVLAVLLVSHRRPQVTVIARTASGWEQREYRAGQRVELTTPPLELSVDELYAGIELDAG